MTYDQRGKFVQQLNLLNAALDDLDQSSRAQGDHIYSTPTEHVLARLLLKADSGATYLKAEFARILMRRISTIEQMHYVDERQVERELALIELYELQKRFISLMGAWDAFYDAFQYDDRLIRSLFYKEVSVRLDEAVPE